MLMKKLAKFGVGETISSLCYIGGGFIVNVIEEIHWTIEHWKMRAAYKKLAKRPFEELSNDEKFVVYKYFTHVARRESHRIRGR